MVTYLDTIFWAAIMIVFIIIEAATPQLVSIWFAAGALTAAVSSLFLGRVTAQLLVFLGVSALCLFMTKPFAGKMVRRSAPPTNADMVIGKTAVVIEGTNPATGTARAVVMGETWAVVDQNGSDLSVGQTVTVKKISGVKLIVEAAVKKGE